MKENHSMNIMDKIIYIALGIILFILPFPRGLFFEKEIVPVELAVYLVFIFWSIMKLAKKEKLQIKSLLAIAVCLLPIAYMLPTFLGYAANKTDAISYVMRYTAYLAVFVVVSDITKNIKHIKLWFYIMAASGLFVGLFGIDSLAGGAVGTKLGFVGIGFTWNRLYGIFQYANTTGMYFGAMFFILIAIALTSSKKFVKVVSGSIMFVMLTGIMLTMSRGAIILIPVVYLLVLLLLKGKTQKIELLLVTITPAIMTLVLYNPLQIASPIINEATGVGAKVWLLIVAGILVTGVISFGLLFLINVFDKVSKKTYNIVFVSIIAVLIIGALVVYFSGIYMKIIPQVILDRFMQTGEQATSGRSDFYRDGLRVLKDNWLLGAGGGAWNALYRAYQSYDYGSSEAHNLLLQIWIETGLFGIASYLIMLVAAVKAYIDCRKHETGNAALLLLAGIVYIIGHSMIDFNFSYLSIPIIVFTLLGALNGIATQNKKKVGMKLPAWGATAFMGVFATVALCFIMARGYAVQATTVLSDGQITADKILLANEKMQKATKLNPWNVNFYVMEKKTDGDMQVDLDTLYDWVAQVDATNQSALQLHADAITKAVALNPKNPMVNIKAAGFMLNKAGKYEEGLAYMDKALKSNPMAYGRYEETANAYYEVGRVLSEQGDGTKAKTYLERVIKLEDDIKEINKRAIKPIKLNQNTLSYIEKAKTLLQ